MIIPFHDYVAGPVPISLLASFAIVFRGRCDVSPPVLSQSRSGGKSIHAHIPGGGAPPHSISDFSPVRLQLGHLKQGRPMQSHQLHLPKDGPG